LGVYKVEETIKENFVANAIKVEMQCRHFYIFRHATKVGNAATTYQTKHKIVHTDMV
jgi:hypothetical protein